MANKIGINALQPTSGNARATVKADNVAEKLKILKLNKYED